MSAAQITKAGAAVAIAHVSKRFGEVKALSDVSLAVAPGAILCLIGRPGAGKSTLLRCIGGSEAIDEGTIQIDGASIEAETARQGLVVGMVSQRPELFDHMTALQHILEGPLGQLRLSRREIVAEAMAALERAGLADRRDAYPSELSGGERWRLGVARVSAARPRLMLLDEPTAGLDPDTAGEVLAVMRNLATSGLTMIAATHELGFISDVADGVAFMAGGEIVEHGSPQTMLTRPRQARTRDFLAALSV
ncbi:amino acid ABC transporter ATP-binding protein [Bosea beijingensis]|uniref:amino acid ABC transporter ATP-binding protein n=1 Tax=Bosea beijingensis TaxID=3068632 RepID=UPI00274170F5|nr:ATP-binding cassette domain-containing protein [Bosea sp. REN20]